MTNSVAVFRSLVIYGLCLPLAVTLGYLLKDPMSSTTFTVVGLVLFLFFVPILLRWHHPLLILSWNTSAVVFFLPGRPNLWLLMAFLSLLVTILQRALTKRMDLVHVPSVTWPLVFLVGVIILTAKLTGGIGLRSLGSEVYGGKRYFMLLGAIAGYFALSSHRIPLERANSYVALFYLSGISMAVGQLISYVNPGFYFLFMVFPIERLPGAVTGPEGIERFGLLAFACNFVFFYMMARYGIRGLFASGKPLRLVLFVVLSVLGLFGGYRSTLIVYVITFAIQFYLEGLVRTRLLPIFLFVGALSGACLLPLAHKLPASIQRTMAWVPGVEIDPVVRLDAQGSTEWRLKMWRAVLPQVPKYLLLGKGYSFSANEAVLVLQDVAFRFSEGSQGSALVGDFHNGPLSVLVPFGLWGAIAWLWFLAAALRVLYFNYKYGDPALRHLNTFFFAVFLMRTLFFFVVFGGIESDMLIFAGLLGLSVSLNGGVARPQPAEAPSPEKLRAMATILPRVRPAL